MRILCALGEHQYGDPSRGLGTEFVAFVPALRNLGHEVLHFETRHRSDARDYAQLNRLLLQTVDSTNPDAMLVVPFRYELWIETLEAIRARGVATMCWTTDDSWKYWESSRFYGPCFDAITTTYDYVIPQYKRDGIHHVHLTQWAASSAFLMPPRRARDCDVSVSFVGAAHGNRKAQIAALHAAGIDVHCFGYGWPAGPVAAEEIPRIINRSILSLNFANTPGYRQTGPNQIKARTFEVPGSGGLLLTESAPGLENFYVPDKEVLVFRGVADLIGKIQHFLMHPEERDQIANAGYQRTVKDHTYEARLKQLIEFAFAQKAQRNCDTEPSASFDAVAERHRLTTGLALLRRGLDIACRPIWGPNRGPKAARRLVFELSRRLAGRHTFSAAGWPGRMFPEQ